MPKINTKDGVTNTNKYSELNEDLLKLIEERAMNLWLEVSEKYVPYKVEERGGILTAYPASLADEEAAMLKQFGSGTKGIKAEFWYEKAELEWSKRIRKLVVG